MGFKNPFTRHKQDSVCCNIQILPDDAETSGEAEASMEAEAQSAQAQPSARRPHEGPLGFEATIDATN